MRLGVCPVVPGVSRIWRWPASCNTPGMRLRSRPLLFARVFADAVTTRPMLSALLALRRAGEPAAPPEPVAFTPEAPAAPVVSKAA